MSASAKALLCLTFLARFGTAQTDTRPQFTPQGRAAELAEVDVALSEQRWGQAEQLLRAYLIQRPGASEATYLLARTLFHENRPKESLEEYTEAAKLARPSAVDFRYIALDYVLLKDYTDADRWITRSARDDASDGETWYAMGRIKYTENRFQEAVDSFNKALVYLPRSVKAENNLGLALEGLNQPDKAVLAYRQAIAWQQGAPHPSEQPFLNLGSLLIDRNELDEALSLLIQAATLAPRDSKIHAALGKVHQRRSEFPQAQAEFEQAVAAEPNVAALHFQLGQVYRKEGLEARAREELTRAAALDGRHSSDR